MRQRVLLFIALFILAAQIPANAQSWDWGSVLQGSNTSTVVVVRGVDTDPSGNSFVTGFFNGTISALGNTLVSQGDDIFIARFDAAGNLIYVIQGGGQGDDYAMGIAYEDYGRKGLYITGSVQFYDLAWNVIFTGVSGSPLAMAPVGACGNPNINIGPLLSAKQIFVAKFTAGGEPIWAKAVYSYLSSDCSATNDSEGLAVHATFKELTSVVMERNVYITGYFTGGSCSFQKANCTFITVGGNSAVNTAFVAKFNGDNGGVMWAKSLYSANRSSSSVGKSITHDLMSGSRNLYITGDFRQSVNLGSTMNALSSGQCGYVARINGTTGAYIWSQQIYSPGESISSKDIVSSKVSQAIYVSGDFTGSTLRVSGSGVISSGTGDSDVFLARFNGSNGALGWMNTEDCIYPQYNASVDINSDESLVYISGVFHQNLTFNSGDQLNTTRSGMFESDHFLAKYDASNGSLMCASRYDADYLVHPALGSDVLFANDIKLHRSQDLVYMAGVFSDYENPQIPISLSTNSWIAMYIGRHRCCECPAPQITSIDRDPVGMATSITATLYFQIPDCASAAFYILTYANMSTGQIFTVQVPSGSTQFTVNGLDATVMYRWQFLGGCVAGNAVYRSTAQDESQIGSKPSVYPVPASDYLNLLIPSESDSEQIAITVYDIQGKTCTVSQEGRSFSEDGILLRIDVRELPVGTYLLHWIDGAVSGSTRFVVSR